MPAKKPAPAKKAAPAKKPAAKPAPAKKGCNGAIASIALATSIPALMGVTVLFFRKRKGGK